MMIFEAWECEEEGQVTFSTTENILDQKEKGQVSSDAKLLHRIEVNSWIEAQVVHHQKMGWEPYKPMDEDKNI